MSDRSAEPVAPGRLALLALAAVLCAGLASEIDWRAWGEWGRARWGCARLADTGDVRDAARASDGWSASRRYAVDRGAREVALAAHVAPPPNANARARGTFRTFELLIDPAGTPLAAWQCRVEASAIGTGARLVGVENGDDPAYPDPARYDPLALRSDVVRLAAYSLARELPTEPFVAARLHVWVPDGASADWTVRVEALADTDGRAIETAGARLRPPAIDRVDDPTDRPSP